jgi:Putative beta barrel porin-7 (BBP7)
VGYDFTWISRVARPGNQIDTLVSIPPVAGGAQPVATPVYLNNPTSIWMQGIITGLEYRF